ncbi:MAG TPA: protein kinase [Kofleriaceae bacterium]
MSEPDLSGIVLDERYQVIAPIAKGAMGAVYRGERVRLGRAVAIKILHDALPAELASRERFEREAKLMARLEHPHCVSVIDFGLHDGKPFLVMDLVRGTSLLELLQSSGPLDPARVSELMRQVLSGLAHAHELGIVHRDIKPANVMLTEKTGLGEQVLILDFGLARPASETTKLTTGMVVGTPNYMAPEQIKGGDVDGRTDLYACGVMLFELLTGQKPFRADDPIVVVRKHLHDPPPKLADVRPGIELGDLEQVVARALAKSPSARYASAEEMSAAIERAAPRPMPHAIPRRVSTQSSSPLATASGWSLNDKPAETAVPSEPSPPQTTGPIAPDPAAPSRPLNIPPTRMHAARRFTPRQLVIGGGAIGLLLIIIVAATRGSGDATPAPVMKPVVVIPIDARPADPIAPVVGRIADLYSNGDVEPGLALATKARQQYPDSAQLAFLEGKLYFAKLWWNDGIKALRDAIRLDAGYRRDPELIKLVIRAFLTTPDSDSQLAELLDRDIGDPAKPLLEETAKTNPNPALRARASDELRRFP